MINRIALFVIMMATWVAVLLILSGCATKYHAVRTDPATGVTTEINVTSYREFEGGISILYNRETGSFEVQAGEVSTGTSPLEEAAAAILMKSVQVQP